jgi:hypothetical protein
MVPVDRTALHLPLQTSREMPRSLAIDADFYYWIWQERQRRHDISEIVQHLGSVSH